MAGGVRNDRESEDLVDRFFAGTLSKSLLVSLIADVFTAPDFYESCWDEFEALFRRVVWVYPDNWMVTFAPNEGVFVQHLLDKWNGQGAPRGEVIHAIARFAGVLEFVDGANGFQIRSGEEEMPSADQIVMLVDALALEHGEPTLHLTWSDVIERMVDEIEDLMDEDAEAETRRAYELMQRVFDTQDQLPSAPWPMELTESDALMSAHSAHDRFYEMLDELENRNWIVVNSECCGTCAGGSVRFAREADPSKANSPAFVVFEQNAESTWGPSGWVYVMESQGEGFSELVDVALAVGLRVEPDPHSDTIVYIRG